MASSKKFWIIILLLGYNVISKGQSKATFILSSRYFHPNGEGDTLNTLKMIDIYKPDRMDWMYLTNLTSIDSIKRKGLAFSLALNPQIPDSLNYTRKGRIINMYGERLVAPWMRSWHQKNGNWGCVNSNEFRELLYQKTVELIKTGADGVLFDDARLNDHALEWGGCFCENCMARFEVFLNAKNIYNFSKVTFINDILATRNGSRSNEDMNFRKMNFSLSNEFIQFQRESVVNFLKDWYSFVKEQSSVLLYANNGNCIWDDIYSNFDGGISEITPRNLTDSFFIGCKTKIAKLNKSQTFTLVSKSVYENVKFLIYSSIYEFPSILPWDVMVFGEKGNERFYGNPGDFNPVIKILHKGVLISKKKYEEVNVEEFRFKNDGVEYIIILSSEPNLNEQIYTNVYTGCKLIFTHPNYSILQNCK